MKKLIFAFQTQKTLHANIFMRVNKDSLRNILLRNWMIRHFVNTDFFRYLFTLTGAGMEQQVLTDLLLANIRLLVMLLSKLTPLWLIFEDQHHCFTQGSDMIFQFQFLGSLWANCYRIKDRTAHCQKTSKRASYWSRVLDLICNQPRRSQI